MGPGRLHPSGLGPRPDETAGYPALVPLAGIDYLITLEGELDAFGPYGLRKPLRRIGIQVDEKERFEERLAQLGRAELLRA